jgi:hypothetical protein
MDRYDPEMDGKMKKNKKSIKLEIQFPNPKIKIDQSMIIRIYKKYGIKFD